MNMNALCEELKYTLREIQIINDRMGEMNKEAIILTSKRQLLQAQLERIEVDLTTIKLEVL